MDKNQHIIEKYRRVANFPDWLFTFTRPMRQKAVGLMRLTSGDRVLDLGCGTGASFEFLLEAVGFKGTVVGVDISPDMILAAQARVRQHGWHNIQLIESPAETLTVEPGFDAILLFAMHDVLTSPAALDNILLLLKPGGRLVAVGPMLARRFPAKLLNPAINKIYHRFAVSQQDKDQPWRLLAERIVDLQIEEYGPGFLYLVSGNWRPAV